MTEGPPLARLTRRLQATPAAFLPGDGDPQPDAPAVLADVLRQVRSEMLWRPPQPWIGEIATSSGNARAVALVAAWLLADDAFAGQPDLAPDAERLLTRDLAAFAEIVPAGDCVTDAGRREELARFVLWALKLRPRGETPDQALDRLTTLDSVARLKVVREAQVAEERARRIREALKRKAAAEAAAKVMRE